MGADLDGATASAQVWLGGGDFERRRFPIPPPAEGELVVAVELATVCGSDAHTVSGRRAAACPSILGHEAVGRVVAVGPPVAPTEAPAAVAVGDRVVWSVTVGCGTCDRCGAGLTAKCRTVRKAGHEALAGSWPLSGAYSTHVLLPRGTTVVLVPPSVPDAAAAVSACAVATVMACLEAAGPVGGRWVLVSGIGMLGLVACAVAVERGASAVLARDLDPSRLALAERFGATPAPASDDRSAPPDVVLELSGAIGAVRAALAEVAVGGCVVLAGSVAPAGSVEVDPEQLVRGLLTIRGVHNYEPRHLEEAIEVLAGGLGARLAEVVAPPVGLDELPGLLRGPAGPHLRRSVDPRR